MSSSAHWVRPTGKWEAEEGARTLLKMDNDVPVSDTRRERSNPRVVNWCGLGVPRPSQMEPPLVDHVHLANPSNDAARVHLLSKWGPWELQD